ncbi:MAG TPA: hypothetical protein VLI42_00025, partial [Chthoniobacterales bacterium]|nr:hypothetical protein [Chthoniobacterales bacterium]
RALPGTLRAPLGRCWDLMLESLGKRFFIGGLTALAGGSRDLLVGRLLASANSGGCPGGGRPHPRCNARR